MSLLTWGIEFKNVKLLVRDSSTVHEAFGGKASQRK